MDEYNKKRIKNILLSVRLLEKEVYDLGSLNGLIGDEWVANACKAWASDQIQSELNNIYVGLNSNDDQGDIKNG